MRDYDNFINGRFIPSTASRGESRSPTPLRALRSAQYPTALKRISMPPSRPPPRLRRSGPSVRPSSVHRRCGGSRRKIREQAEPLARVITEEQGKTLGLARVEVAFTADYLDYMAEWARRIEGEILESDRAGETILLFRQPIGVIGGILPWNFPFFLIARKAAPALVTGNTIVIKPSEETPHNAVKFCEIARAKRICRRA